MEIGLTGASGFLGREIIEQATSQGDEVVAFSRNANRPVPGCLRTESYGISLHVNGLDAVVHLAGEPIFGIWTKSKRDRILRSRLEGTRSVVKAIQGAPKPPRVLVCASGVGIYGDRGEEVLTERHTIGSGEFLTDVSQAWEAEAQKAAEGGIRVVSVRIAMVLGPKGALHLMRPLFSLGLGGQIGRGDQWMSWIHIRDIANVFLHAVRTESISGAVNGSSPNPIRNSEFTKALGEVLQKPTVFTVPSWLLKTVLPKESALVLDSQRAIPEKLLASGFQFQFPSLGPALEDIIKSRPDGSPGREVPRTG